MSVAPVQIPLQRASLICPACGAPSAEARHAWRFVNARGETEWLRCPKCRSYFMDGEYNLEQETLHTQQMTWGDAEHGAEVNVFKQRMYQAVLRQICCRMDPQGRSLLDVGCSYGGFMKAARETGFQVTGFDIVPSAVEHVRRQGMSAECCGNVSEFHGTPESFDVISVLDANIYWPNQPAELSGIFRRLNPGGLLVMRIVDKSWMARVGAILKSVAPGKAQSILRRAVNDHRFSMPAASLLRLLAEAGFEVISATPRGAVHSDQTSLAVKLSFGIGIALWETLGVFLAPGAVVIAEKPATC